MSDGSFDMIFNICRASDDPINRFGVPRGFEQIHLGPEDVASLPEFHDPGSHVSNATIDKRRLGVDAGAESNVFLPLGAGAVVEISTSSKKAAVLLLPDGASRANLRPVKKFRNYVIKYAQRWYEFVNGNLERMVENGDLYLVTGMDKTSSWSIAAAENQSENSRISLKLKAAQVGAVQASYIWEWEAASSFAASGPRRPPAEESWGQNQTVFLRGYKVAIRSTPLKKSAKALSIVDSKPSDILSKSGFIPFSESPSGSSSFFRGASTSGQGSASDDVGSPPSSDGCGASDSSGSSDKEELVEYLPQSTKLYHPGYAINEYLLSSTADAMVAVTHDNDWMSLLNEDDEEIPEDYELTRRISHTYTIENVADGVWLEHIDSGTNGDKDEDSKTVQVVYPQAAHHDGGNLYPAVPADIETRVVYTSASFMPASLHPYLNSSPAASRSSQDITAHPITQESYSLHSLSVQHLPATLSVQQPPAATLSVQHLPVLPPSPNLGPGGYLPSANSSVMDLHLVGPATKSPSQSKRSSVYGDIAVASLPCLNDVHPRIFPVAPENVQRYTRKTIIPNDSTMFQIKPLTISVTTNPPPPGWTTCQHPEGAQYFFHEEKRVFTDANLFDNASLTFIDENIHKVHDFLRVHSVHLPPGVDLVLDEYVYDDGSKGCQYYFVNHQDRCVFWMDRGDSDLFPVTQEVKGMKSASHIRYELEAQYWLHCEYYPTAFEVTHEIIDELRDIVLHALGDVITSSTSTVSWKVDDLKNMITLIDGCAKNVGKHSHKKFSGSSCLVARLMHVFARNRVYNFHGDPGARLNVDQSVHPTVKKRTALIKMLTPLLFYAPDSHLLCLHAIYTDGLIRHRGWSEYAIRLNDEWQELILYAIVVLNANVAFLAIQSVDNGGVTSLTRSPTEISSYLSMLTSVGSIILGLLLAKHHRNRDRASAADAADAANFIFHRTHPTLGLETLAVLYSLPYAMLTWSMVSFLAALTFSFMCLQDSDLLTRPLVAVAVVVSCCVYLAVVIKLLRAHRLGLAARLSAVLTACSVLQTKHSTARLSH